jgi:hypothetical protein
MPNIRHAIHDCLLHRLSSLQPRKLSAPRWNPGGWNLKKRSSAGLGPELAAHFRMSAFDPL